jgi:hypothetical protein
MRVLFLSLVLMLTAVGCGGREPTEGASGSADGGPEPTSGCRRACVSTLERALEQHFGATVDCNDHGWAAAQTCAACIQLLEDRYDVAVTSEPSFCSSYFP